MSATAFIYRIVDKVQKRKEGEIEKEWDFVLGKVSRLLPV